MKNILLFQVFLFCFFIVKGQEIKEPDFTYQVNYLEENGKLGKQLESQVPKAKHAAYSYTLKYEVPGSVSDVRFTNKKPSFVVNMNDNSKDIEGIIYIFKIESKRNSRKGQYKSRNLAGDSSYIPFNFERYGAKSYKLTVSEELEAGEYIILIMKRDVGKANLFGID